MANIGLEYKGVSQIYGPIVIVENVRDVGYDELVEVKTQSGEIRLGKSYRGNPESRNRPSF